jgi:hypothetical protein
MSNGNYQQEIWTFLWGEHPANPSALQDCDKDSKTLAVDSCLHILASCNVFGLDGLCGKTSPVFCQADKDETLVPSLGRWGNWGMGGRTGCWTLNGSEHNGIPMPSRSVGDVCSLSDVLETCDLPHRFSLSAKACSGILRRAERRGKSLPPMLKAALQAAAGGMVETPPEL